MVLAWGCWKHTYILLGPLRYLEARLFARRCLALWLAPWCHPPWLDDGALYRRWWRCPVSHVAHGRWLLRQQAGWHNGVFGGTDELGDALEPLHIEVVDWEVAEELPRHEQSSLRVRRAATRVGGQSSWGQR